MPTQWNVEKLRGLIKQLTQRPLIGLDIGVSGIKAVELTSTARGKRLVAYNRVPLPWGAITAEGEVKDRPAVLSALQELFAFKGFSTRHVAVGGFGSSIITKKIVTERMPPSELREQLYWEAEQYIPFNINDVNLDFAILETATESPEQMEVLLVAAKKEFIQGLSGLLEEAGLKADVVDNPAFALGNVFEFNYAHTLGGNPGTAPLCALIDFGAGSTRVSIVEGDKTTFTRDLRQCGMACTLMISERLGLNLTEAEEAKLFDFEDEPVRFIIDEFNHSLTEEIARTIDYVLGQNSERSVQGIFYCGGGSRLSGLIDELEARMTAPVAALNPVQNIAGSGKKMNAQAIRELRYLGTIAVGLALRLSGDSE
jgi:type IV pilus assembly protein PilM